MVAGIHTAADPLSIAGIRIAGSYRAGHIAGNTPVPEVAPAGNTLVTPLADKSLLPSPVERQKTSQEAAAAPLVLYHLRMEVVSHRKTDSQLNSPSFIRHGSNELDSSKSTERSSSVILSAALIRNAKHF